MGSGTVLPMGRFFPARGIIVDRADKSLTIMGTMELYGPAATGSNAGSIEQSINKMWTNTFADGYSVKCRITVRFRGPGSKAGNVTQIEARVTSGPSFVGLGSHGRYMVLNAKEPTAFTWTAAHEFGHIVGLQDRYSESIVSKLGGMLGATRSTAPEPGYAGNLMAAHGGALWSKNIADVAVENEPSPYWINDDDYVADWINTHGRADVANLSTRDKLTAMRTLLGGWVSVADVTAIERVCQSVSTEEEATAIRNRLDLLKLTDLGQRTTVRLALSKMP
jgi:hypothetical protein